MLLDHFGNPVSSQPAGLEQFGFAFGSEGVNIHDVAYPTFNPFHQEGHPLPKPLNFEALSDRLYRKNAIAYSCIRALARSASEPEFVACTIDAQGVEQIDDPFTDPLAKLIAQPNEEQEAYEFFEQMIIHLQATGNAFIRKLRSRAKGVASLVLLRPDLISIVPQRDKSGRKVAQYFYEPRPGKKEPIPARDIVHMKLPDVFDEFWGLSPLYVLLKFGDIDEQATDFMRSYFLNRGVPSGMLVVEGRIQEPDRQELKDQWRTQYNGYRLGDRQGWGGVAVLDKGVRYEQLSSGLKDIRLDPIFNQSETRICMVFGVPPILVGTASGLERSTFSNFAESRRGFWTDTLIPMYTRIVRRLTKKLAQEDFGERRTIKADVSKVAGIQENKEKLRALAVRGWKEGLFTVNEARAVMDMPPLPEGQNGDAVRLGTQTIYVPRDQAVQFADLTGDVVTDIVQNEILETEEGRIGGVGDPNPAVDKPDREDPAEQKLLKAKRLEEEAKRLRKEAKQNKKDKEELDPDEEERGYEPARETLALFDPNTGDCLQHGEFACRECQEVAQEADVLTVDDLINLIIQDDDQEALSQYLSHFPANFAETLTTMIDRIVGGDMNEANGIAFLRTIVGLDLRPIMSLFTLVLEMQAAGKTDDEVAASIFNAASRLKEEGLT